MDTHWSIRKYLKRRARGLRHAGSVALRAFAVAALLLTTFGPLPGAVRPTPVAQAQNETWSDLSTPRALLSAAVGDYYRSQLGEDAGETVTSVAVASNGDIYVGTSRGVVWRSTTKGVSFATFGGLTAGTLDPIVDIAIGLNYATDKAVFIAEGAANGIVLRSVNGANFATIGAPGATANFTIKAIDVTPNYDDTREGCVLAALDITNADADSTLRQRCQTSGAFGNWTTIVLPTAAAASDNVLDAVYSPNWAGDGGRIRAVWEDQSAATVNEVECIGAACNVLTNLTANNSIPGDGTVTRASIALPSGWAAATADSYFIGFSDAAGNDADMDVYRKSGGVWQDSNVAGAGTARDIYSVAVSGAFANAILLAGLEREPTVFKSSNGGINWQPGGAIVMGAGTTSNVNCVTTPDFATSNTAYCSAAGSNGGFNKTTSGGASTSSWYQSGIFADEYDTVAAMALVPGFGASNQVAFLVMNDAGADDAVFKSSNALAIRSGQQTEGSGAQWTKRTGAEVLADIRQIAAAQDYATSKTLWVADATTLLARSTNGGDTFTAAGITSLPANICAACRGLAAPSMNEVFVLGTLGRVYRTTDGAGNWTQVTLALSNLTDIVLSPNFAMDKTLAVGGLEAGGSAVYVSTDGGGTYSRAANIFDSTGSGTTVAFHDMFSNATGSTNKWMFAGSQTSGDVYRLNFGTDTAWRDMDANRFAVGGEPAVAGGDFNVGNLAVADGVVYATEFNGSGNGVHRALYPAASYDGTRDAWLALGWSNARTGGTGDPKQNPAGTGDISDGLVAGADLDRPGGFAALKGSNWLFAIDTNAGNRVYTYKDNLLTAPTLSWPPDDAGCGGHPTAANLCNSQTGMFQWSAVSGVLAGTGVNVTYGLQVSTDPAFKDNALVRAIEVTGTTQADITAGGAVGAALTFTQGNTYYWRVRAQVAADATNDVQGPWSVVRKYGGQAAVPNLIYPTNITAGEVADLRPTFIWALPAGSAQPTGYQLQVSSNPNDQTSDGSFVNTVIDITFATATTSYRAEMDLASKTVYTWHVRAITGTVKGRYSNSAAFLTPEAPAITSPPTLAGPATGSTLTTLGTALGWTNQSGTQQVRLRWTPANGDGPEGTLIFSAIPAVTSYTINPPNFGVGNYHQLPDMGYTWCVAGSSKGGSLSMTDASWGPDACKTFRTPKRDSSTITLGAATVAAGKATFSWTNSAADVFYYEVQASTDRNFGELGAIAAVEHQRKHGGETTPPNSYTTGTMASGSTVYYRVRPRIQGDGTPVAWTASRSVVIP